jgi:uncharacterized membrane protein
MSAQIPVRYPETTDREMAETNPIQEHIAYGNSIRVQRTLTVNSTPAELYAFWRDFRNLPLVMKHLHSVTVLDNDHSHWVASAPGNSTVEWDAEIIEDVPNEKISWRSAADADVMNAGSVQFLPAPPGRGTRVKVALAYEPPAGKLGQLIAKLFGEEPEKQIQDDLRRFKQYVETGEVATTEGQPEGNRSMLSKLSKGGSV